MLGLVSLPVVTVASRVSASHECVVAPGGGVAQFGVPVGGAADGYQRAPVGSYAMVLLVAVLVYQPSTVTVAFTDAVL